MRIWKRELHVCFIHLSNSFISKQNMEWRERESEREKQNMIMCKHLLNQLIFEFLFCVYMLGSVLFPSLHPLLYCCTPAVFRAGEQGRFWYAVLGGSLEVRYHTTDTETKVRIVNTPFPVFYLFNFFPVAHKIQNLHLNLCACFYGVKKIV